MTPPPRSRVGIRDVARVAGVSTATVSQAYNHPEEVSPKTRDHVLAVGARMGYRPNPTGRALRSGRSRMLCVVASFRDPLIAEASFMPGFEQLVAGAVLGASELGYGVIVGRAAADGRILSETAFDGLVIVDPMPSDPLVERGLADEHPVVTSGSYADRGDARMRSVGLDLTSGVPIALERLRERAGGKRFRPAVFIGARLDRFTNELIAAYQAWCAEQELPPQGAALQPGESLLDVASRLLSSKSRPTAVLCPNESFSHALLQAASRLGLAAPDDFGIITVGNPEGIGRQQGVGYLATDQVANGASCARLLVSLIERRDPESLSLPLPFVETPRS